MRFDIFGQKFLIFKYKAGESLSTYKSKITAKDLEAQNDPPKPDHIILMQNGLTMNESSVTLKADMSGTTY